MVALRLDMNVLLTLRVLAVPLIVRSVSSTGAAPGVLSLSTIASRTDDFETVVGQSSLLLVEFYAPWCGHCKQLAPKYEEAATKLNGLYRPNAGGPPLLAALDATSAPQLAAKYQVSGYPTLILFSKGLKVDTYDDLRETPNIVEYMSKLLENPRQLEKLASDAEKAAEASALVETLSADAFDHAFQARTGGTMVSIFHSKMCEECPARLEQVAAAAVILKGLGYADGILTELDTMKGGSMKRGGGGPRRFAHPCKPNCQSCRGYPCTHIFDIAEDGSQTGRQVTFSSTSQLVGAVTRHLKAKGVRPGERNGHTGTWLDENIANVTTDTGKTEGPPVAEVEIETGDSGSVHNQIRDIYSAHKPDMLGGHFDKVLKKYEKGKQGEALLQGLKEKYAPLST